MPLFGWLGICELDKPCGRDNFLTMNLFGGIHVKRAYVWGNCIATTIITALLNLIGLKVFGFEAFSFTMFFLVPVGAIVASVVALSGFGLSAKYLDFSATKVDLAFLFACVGLFIFLVHGFEYLAATTATGVPIRHLVGFSDFFAHQVVATEYTFHQHGVGKESVPAGEFGWMLLIPRIGCVLAIARVTYSFSEDGLVDLASVAGALHPFGNRGGMEPDNGYSGSDANLPN